MADFEKIREGAGWTLFVTLCVGVPGYFYGNWDKFGTNKTPFQWFDEKGWRWRLVLFALLWFFLCALAGFSLYWVMGALARLLGRKGAKGKSKLDVETPRDLAMADPLDAIRLAEARSEWGKLTNPQRALLQRIVASGGLNWDQVDVGYWKSLPVYSDLQLSDYLLERSTLLEHRSKGFADLRRYIQSRKEGKTDFTLGLRTWKVKVKFIDALQQVVAEPVAETRLLLERPELDIIFDENLVGCTHRFQGVPLDGRGEVADYELYRVAVTSPVTAPGTRVRVVGLTLDGSKQHYPSLDLRIAGKPDDVTEFKLHPDVTEFWDVIEKPIGSDWFRITHTVKNAGEIICQAPKELTIRGSSDNGTPVSKLIKIDVDRTNNNAMIFKVLER